MEERIRNLLKKCGVPAHLLGYRYLIEAVKLCKSDEKYMQRITTMLYPTIAKNYNSTVSRVERAIRHSIKNASNNLNPDMVFELFGNTIKYKNDKPTNSHFIATLIELI